MLNRGGDSIVGAPVVLDTQNPDTIGIDTARQAVIGRSVGPGRVLASSGDLHSDLFTILVK